MEREFQLRTDCDGSALQATVRPAMSFLIRMLNDLRYGDPEAASEGWNRPIGESCLILWCVPVAETSLAAPSA